MENKSTKLYIAPLQGLTDWIFRESFYEHIGAFDKSFSPFIRIENSEYLRPSQKNDISIEHNTFQKPIPQFLGNDINSFFVFEDLCKSLNYSEVNINLGCPFIKVTKQHLGSGLLQYPEEIDSLLESIFSKSKLKISIKCRLGQTDSSEFEKLIPIFNKYPLHELIIHARTGIQLYKGDIQLDVFSKYLSQINHPVCYNGDINTVYDLENIIKTCPTIDSIMIGRGIIKNPFLLSEIREEKISNSDKIEKLQNFHLAMIERCAQKYSGDFSILKRFEELWELHSEGFENGRKIFKQVKKCRNISQYKTIVFQEINSIFD